MSFAEQERALFDLLFDTELRAGFCRHGVAALPAYALDKAELDDFAAIRQDALELDAKMRRHIVLGHLCRALPLSFALVASVNEGRTLLKNLVDTVTMRTSSLDRAAVFASRLREQMALVGSVSESEGPLLLSILDAERAMALTAASLKKQLLETGQRPAEVAAIPADWSTKVLKLAPHVGAVVIPQPYADLKRAFCQVADAGLWTHLDRYPPTQAQRRKLLEHASPRLLVLRARVLHLSACDPQVDHQSVELSEGFAPLLQHLNGSMSIEQILTRLEGAGASAAVLKGVGSGFRTLLEAAMLELD